MSASMRNAIQRRPHRERAQPHERRQFGLLEKHKDYSLRAKDYNKKKAHLKNLRQKASERNEDEFYFGMHSRKGPGSSIIRGKGFTGKVEGDRGNVALDTDVVRLLKTQDVAYVRTVANVVRKQVEELRRKVVMAGGGQARQRKIVFAEGLEEREEMLKGKDEDEVAGDADGFDAFDDEDDLDDGMEDEEGGEIGRKDESELEKLERKLEAMEKKLNSLRKVETYLEIQQAKMAKTATSGGTTRKGKKLMVRKRKK
ncbi:hypothetical protein jhhlp_001030 [Lomentospora prolificans]|uniref:U3 small nucleolar RNA-associated protein 11 n=1 Tax=Lomentospora prolificans TaxID=41688 RepID=A0A2N3NK73_9PEZI|nr:hypothetical protein jhhlp_001030 [Lomentospora prolificans]